LPGDGSQDGAGQFLGDLGSAVALQQGGQRPLSTAQELLHVWQQGMITRFIIQGSRDDHMIHYPGFKAEPRPPPINTLLAREQNTTVVQRRGIFQIHRWTLPFSTAGLRPELGYYDQSWATTTRAGSFPRHLTNDCFSVKLICLQPTAHRGVGKDQTFSFSSSPK